MTSKDGRAFALALVVFAAFFAAVFSEGLRSRQYLIAPSDALDLGVADYLSTPSYWTEGLYSGYPIAADPQSLTWYPVLQLFRLLGIGWNVFMIAPYVLASATCFLFVRRLTASNIGGAFGGLVFGFSGPMFGNMGHFNQLHAIAWAPLALYGLQRIREGLHRSGAAITSVALVLMWLAGHPQLPVYTLYLSAAFMVGGVCLDRPVMTAVVARLKWSAAAVALALGIAAVMIVPLVELSALSPRAESSWQLYIGKALPAWQLLTVGLPFSFGFWAEGGRAVSYFGDGAAGENLAYVGLVPLALAAAAPFVPSTYRRDARLWVSLAVVAALLALGPATPVGTLFYYAPGYARFRVPSRHLFLMALCLSVASGYAIAELTRQLSVGALLQKALVRVVAVALLMFAVFAWLTPHVSELLASDRVYAAWTIGWPVVIAVAAASVLFFVPWIPLRQKPLMLGLALIVVHVVDVAEMHYRVPGYRFHYADVPVSDAVPRPPIAALRDELQRSGERVIAVDGTHNPFLLPNLTRPWAVRAASGSGPLATERYLDVIGMGSPGDIGPATLRPEHLALDLFAIGYALVPDGSSLEDVFRAESNRWSAVRTLQFEEQHPDSRYTLYRNARVRPPAWCAGTVIRTSAEHSRAAVKEGRLPNGASFDPGTTVLAESDALPDWKPAPQTTEAPIVSADVSRHLYRVQAGTPCVLVVSEQYYPWWRATVDEAPVAVSRINYAMMGIPIPAGVHKVRLSLRPTSVWIGEALSVASLMAWLWLIIVPEVARGAPRWRGFRLAGSWTTHP